MLLRWLSRSKTWFKSLYVQIFVSFLAVCVLLFVGLAVFWNYYFTGLFYNDKQALLDERSGVVAGILSNFQDGTLTTRDLRFATRIVARSFNGDVLYVDAKGKVLSGSTDGEGTTIPRQLDAVFLSGLKGNTGSDMTERRTANGKVEDMLTHYAPYQLGNQPIVVLLQVRADEVGEAIAAVRFNILLPLLFSLVAVGLILFILSRRFAGPVHSMRAAALRIAQGDLTVRVQTSSGDEVGELAESFNYMAEQMQGWEDARQEFLANVSHELRSPLTSLRGLIVAMKDKIVPEDKYGHYLAICDGEVQRLQRLVTDLLDLARIQNGLDVFRMQPVAVQDKLHEVLELMRGRIEAKGLTLATEFPPAGGAPIHVELDPDRFAQIMQNLITNAIQFTPSGGTVKVALEASAEDVYVAVEDTGIGMSEEELRRIWDRFYKADDARSSQPSDGTGLGLTIVKHLALGMNGKIAASSAPGRGSTFCIEFPRIADREFPRAAHREEGADAPGQ
ncbi:sensor histidine kinase [Gordoniibacillus kamchatkensis]|uniref:sensor histidine kinase n=1 Tax=Gordoniibacillus kamchatkensis TaxID=1590651 RepID=UPI000699015C|nr:HAMP domain-containing sensor histidine kinase [Paenibacillus sp. VKM B-2647]